MPDWGSRKTRKTRIPSFKEAETKISYKEGAIDNVGVNQEFAIDPDRAKAKLEGFFLFFIFYFFFFFLFFFFFYFFFFLFFFFFFSLLEGRRKKRKTKESFTEIEIFFDDYFFLFLFLFNL